MRRILTCAATVSFLALATCTTPLGKDFPVLDYPNAPTETAGDDYFGTHVPDPYRWLEKTGGAWTQPWLEAQNDLFTSFVNTPARDAIKARLEAVWNYNKYLAPHREGDRYIVERSLGLQNQMVICTMGKLGETPREVLDPNTLSADGTVAVETEAFTRDGKRLAYGLSFSGSDRQEIHVRNVETGSDLPDVIKWTKFTSVGWLHDGSGFYYNRFPQPGTVDPDDENNFCKIYYHKLGTDQSKDLLVLERPDDKTLHLSPYVSDDGKYLTAWIVQGTAVENEFWYRPVGDNPGHPGDWVKLLDKPDASYGFIDNVGSVFYFVTNLDAPRSRIIAIDINHPERKNWKTIIPQQDDALSSASIIHHQLVLTYLHNAYSVVKLASLDGTAAGEIPLPGLGSIDGVTGRAEDDELFFLYSSYAMAGTIFRYDFKAKKLELYHASEIKVDTSNYVTTLEWATSRDGTKVPLFVTARKDLPRDGSSPALLTAYGGFGVSTQPGWDSARIPWLERGGVFAEAIIRGGGEFGEDWHKAGMLANKQHSFDDFLACAQFLAAQKYTRPDKLAIRGGSNGGLLVAACMVQRPELFGAVVSDVPVTDMLRYPKFAAGIAWIPEYGDASADAATFSYLYAYSPLHNVKPGVAYPPILVTTADSDDRVDPSHSRKFVATLQAAQKTATVKNPILLRVDTKAGHGGGKPMSKVIDEIADSYAFILRALGER